MKRLLWFLLAAAPALSQTIPEPRPMRAVIVRVDVPSSFNADGVEAWAVLMVEEDNGMKWTLYMPYVGAQVPQPGKHCALNIGPGFAKNLVGREVWSKGRQVTALIHADCYANKH